MGTAVLRRTGRRTRRASRGIATVMGLATARWSPVMGRAVNGSGSIWSVRGCRSRRRGSGSVMGVRGGGRRRVGSGVWGTGGGGASREYDFPPF